MIVVNDNPVKWFKKSHPIRIADTVMNQHLAGTYMNYLVVQGSDDDDGATARESQRPAKRLFTSPRRRACRKPSRSC